jgi:type IV pilus assembly protein PilV
VISNKKGFSLLEVVISIGVLSVGILGLVKMQTYMEVKAENALKTIDALYYAEAQMEHIFRRQDDQGDVSKAEDIRNNNLIPWGDILTDKNKCWGDPVSNDLGIKLTCQFTLFNGTLDAISNSGGTYRVTSQWFDRHGNAQSIELKTAVSRYSEFD